MILSNPLCSGLNDRSLKDVSMSQPIEPDSDLIKDLEVRSSWTTWVSEKCPYKRWKRRHRQSRRLCEDGSRDESDATTSQGTPGATALPGRGSEGFFPGLSEECSPSDTMISDFWLPELLWNKCLQFQAPQIGDNLLWLPQTLKYHHTLQLTRAS